MSVTFMGKDGVYNDDVSASYKFFRDDIVFGKYRFADVMERANKKGVRAVLSSCRRWCCSSSSGKYEKGSNSRTYVKVNFEKLGHMASTQGDDDDDSNGGGGGGLMQPIS